MKSSSQLIFLDSFLSDGDVKIVKTFNNKMIHTIDNSFTPYKDHKILLNPYSKGVKETK